MILSGEQENESIIRVRMGKNTFLAIPVCHHSASLVMPISDSWDGIFYPTLTLMMDSYILAHSRQNMPFVSTPVVLPRVKSSYAIVTVNSRIFAGILFSRKALKDIFATLKFSSLA